MFGSVQERTAGGVKDQPEQGLILHRDEYGHAVLLLCMKNMSLDSLSPHKKQKICLNQCFALGSALLLTSVEIPSGKDMKILHHCQSGFLQQVLMQNETRTTYFGAGKLQLFP